MGVFDAIWGNNKFAKFFTTNREELDKQDREELVNSQGLSQEQLDAGDLRATSNTYGVNQMGNFHSGMSSINIQFEQYFTNKAQRISKYREMSFYPEVSDALDIIADDAIIENSDGDIVELKLKEELPEHIEDEVHKHWDYLLNEVFNFNEVGWDLFRKWVVDGEMYIELIMDNEGSDLIGIKVLPAHSMAPIYESGKVVGYVQTTKSIDVVTPQQTIAAETEENIIFDKDQIVYVNYGYTGRNRYDIRGFLEPSVRVYNQLKNLEDAVVIYRIVRAPERRVWNVAVGRMPKTKAEEYIRGMMQRYRKRIKYDSSTGAMDSAQNVQAMTEDFWFAKNAEGEGTTVDTLGGGTNLGEMDDVFYFQKKLYKTLKLPKSRWGGVDDTNMYSGGKSGEITQEEIKFARFIERLQKKFKYILFDSYLTLLRVRGVDDRYIARGLYNINFTQSNLFKQYKELELLESRFALLGSIESYIYKPGENDNGYFAREFVLRRWFMMSDDEYSHNTKLLTEEKATAKATMEANPNFGMDGGDGEGEPGFGDDGEDALGDFGGDELGGGFDEPVGDEPMGGEEGGGEEPVESIDFKIHSNSGNTILNEFVSGDNIIKTKYNRK